MDTGISTRVKNLIEEYLENRPNINLSDFLCQEIKMNPNTISTKFKAEEGMSIQQYSISRRVEKVKDGILAGKSLTEIGFELGYSSVANLSNQFKKITGVNPTDFKKVHQIANV